MVSETKLPGATVQVEIVLILVLVEDGLGDLQPAKQASRSDSLNPCFSGGWSRSSGKLLQKRLEMVVLILVLVEDGLGEQLLELAVSEIVATKILISLTFGDQKYVPFRVLSRVQIYGFFLNGGLAVQNSGRFLGGFCGLFLSFYRRKSGGGRGGRG